MLFALGRRRLLPVKLTELSIVEEAFDPMLNPIRAKVRLGLRVLTVNDVGPNGRNSFFSTSGRLGIYIAVSARPVIGVSLRVFQLPSNWLR